MWLRRLSGYRAPSPRAATLDEFIRAVLLIERLPRPTHPIMAATPAIPRSVDEEDLPFASADDLRAGYGMLDWLSKAATGAVLVLLSEYTARFQLRNTFVGPLDRLPARVSGLSLQAAVALYNYAWIVESRMTGDVGSGLAARVTEQLDKWLDTIPRMARARWADVPVWKRFREAAQEIHKATERDCDDLRVRWLPAPRWPQPFLDWSSLVARRWAELDPVSGLPRLAQPSTLSIAGDPEPRDEGLQLWFARLAASHLPATASALMTRHHELRALWGPELRRDPIDDRDPLWSNLTTAAMLIRFWIAGMADQIGFDSSKAFDEERVASFREFFEVETILRAARVSAERSVRPRSRAATFVACAQWLGGDLGVTLAQSIDILVRLPSAPAPSEHFASYGGGRVEYFRQVMDELESGKRPLVTTMAWLRRLDLIRFYRRWIELLPSSTETLTPIETSRESFTVFFRPWLHLRKIRYDTAGRAAGDPTEAQFQREFDQLAELHGERMGRLMRVFLRLRGRSAEVRE